MCSSDLVALKMQLPLSDDAPPVVQGTVRFTGNEIQLWRSMPSVQSVSGELAFSDRGFQINGIQGGLLGGPIILTGGTQRDGSVQIRAEGSVSVDGIARGFNVAGVRNLTKKCRVAHDI